MGWKGTIRTRTNISRNQNADDCAAVLLPTMQSRGANAGKAEAAGAVTASVSKPPACHGRTGPPPLSLAVKHKNHPNAYQPWEKPQD